MVVWLIVLVPIIVLVIWGIIFDLRRRRRHAVLTSHDIGSAARRAQAIPTLVARVGPTPAAGQPNQGSVLFKLIGQPPNATT